MNIYLTPSMTETLQNCPLAFQQKYLQGLKEPFRPSPASQLGTNIHAALSTFYGRGAHRRQSQADLLGLLAAKWDSAAFTTIEEERVYLEEGRHLLRDFYAATQNEPECRQRLVEKPHRSARVLTLGRHRVTLGGRFDRLDVLADGSIEVVDYKTGQPPATGLPDAAEMAERLDNLIYYRLAAELYPQARSITVSRYYLKSKRKVSVCYTEAYVEAARTTLQELLDQLDQGIALPTQNDGCQWCLVRKVGKCPQFGVETEAEADWLDF